MTDSIPFMMLCVAFALMWGIKRFDMNATFTLNYLFNSLRGTFGFVPVYFFALADAHISYRRITTFLQLPEAD